MYVISVVTPSFCQLFLTLGFSKLCFSNNIFYCVTLLLYAESHNIVITLGFRKINLLE